MRYNIEIGFLFFGLPRMNEMCFQIGSDLRKTLRKIISSEEIYFESQWRFVIETPLTTTQGSPLIYIGKNTIFTIAELAIVDKKPKALWVSEKAGVSISPAKTPLGEEYWKIGVSIHHHVLEDI